VWALLGDGSLVLLPGGVDEYLARRRARAEDDRPSTPAADGDPSAGSAAAQRTARKDLARLDRQLSRLNTRIATVHARMAEHASDFVRLAALDTELTELTGDRERLEHAWLEAAERADG
jgi:ATP-binding cassette subfamily F protein uup